MTGVIEGPVRIQNPTGNPGETRVLLPSGDRLPGVQSIQIDMKPDNITQARLDLVAVKVDLMADPVLDPPLVKAFDLFNAAGKLRTEAEKWEKTKTPGIGKSLEEVADILHNAADTVSRYEAGVVTYE